MHHGWAGVFASFWWLIFPLFWMVSTMGQTWSRHARANRALDLIKSYADQGKEPPAELLQSLRTSDKEDARTRDPSPYGWIPVFLFFGLAAAFVFMAWQESNDASGLIFVAIIMAALALGFLAAMFAVRRGERDRTLPPK